MRKKLFQINGFYIRFDLPSDQKDDILLGIMSNGGYYTACTDMTLSNCKTFEFSEVKIGLAFFSFAFGTEKLMDKDLISKLNGTTDFTGI